MRKSRNRSRKIDIMKVMICLLLVVLVGVVTKVVLMKQNSAPAAKVQGTTSSTSPSNSATPTQAAEKKNLTLSKTTANIFVSNTFDLKVKDTSDPVTYSTSDEKVATVSEAGVVKGIGKGSATITAAVGGVSLKCDVTVRQSKIIALTYDDGPSIYTPKVLDALEKYHAKATFFVVGDRLSNPKYIEYMKRGVALGCEYGNHTYSHPEKFENLSEDAMTKEVNKCSDLMEKITGKKPTFSRIPGGGHSEKISKVIEMPQIGWTLDTNDWRKENRNTAYITKYVLDNAFDGAVVLMHDIHPKSAEAADAIIKGLQEQGYELVTVDELVAANNYDLTPHKSHWEFKNK